MALDFGRITIDDDIVLYLFGTPGQERFWFMWDELGYGAAGVVILADTRRLADCFAAVDYFELRQVPFIVAVNAFDDAPRFHPQSVRVALDLDPRVPIVDCDARERMSCRPRRPAGPHRTHPRASRRHLRRERDRLGTPASRQSREPGLQFFQPTAITRDTYQHVRRAAHRDAAERVVSLLPDGRGEGDGLMTAASVLRPSRPISRSGSHGDPRAEKTRAP